MKTQTIAFVDAGRVELLNEELPEPSGTQVLVRLEYSCISSGTERANLVGDPNVSISAKPDKPTWPRISGYSTCGIVEKKGEAVTTLSVGDRVAMYWSRHSTYNLIEEKNCVKVPANVSSQAAALCHIGCFPLAAIRKCRLEIGEAAIVMGQGVLGQLAIMLLKAAGACPVVACDPVPEKCARALELGADFAIDPNAENFITSVREITEGGPHAAIEVTGNGQALNRVLDVMAPLGRVALLGCTRSSDFTIDYYRKVHGPGISLIGAHTLARPLEESSHGLWTTRDDIRAQLRLLSGHRLHYDRLIQEVHSPKEAPDVYARLARGGAFPVVQFDWRNMP